MYWTRVRGGKSNILVHIFSSIYCSYVFNLLDFSVLYDSETIKCALRGLIKTEGESMQMWFVGGFNNYLESFENRAGDC